jgi:hypothetical protein
MKRLAILLLVLAAGSASAQPQVSECFKVNDLLKMDEDHYWANWTNTCPYTIDSVYVMVQFAAKAIGNLGSGVWALHFIPSGTHRVLRLTAPLNVPKFETIRIKKITTNWEEALRQPLAPLVGSPN